MEQKLFTELRPLYTSSKERPNEIRIRIRIWIMMAVRERWLPCC